MSQGLVKASGVAFLLAFCAVGAYCFQRGVAVHAESEGKAPTPAAEMIVAGLGGFRGLAAEVIWFRADRLQDEGRYGELAQLATWLTFLEPHTPEVWAYSAWNLAYNVSVMMPTPADRWRWVEAGIRLLRDDGLRLNPSDPVLYKELAWLFLMKLGGDLDNASAFYRGEWKKTVQAVVASDRWSDIAMKKECIERLEAVYGHQDWTDPLASALYWGYQGLVLAKGPIRYELRQILFQTLMLQTRKDASIAPRALQEMLKANEERHNEVLCQLIERFSAAYGLEINLKHGLH